MYVESHRGGMAVVETSYDEQQMIRALKDLDRNLILNREIDPDYQCWVWDVRSRWSADHPPVFICTWRDQQGRPLPLSSGLLDLVKSLRSGVDTATQAELSNQRLRERSRKEAADMFSDWGADVLPSLDDKRSVILPRSQSLRMSRDKQRAKGDRGI